MTGVEKILSKFRENPTRITFGAGKLAKRYKVTREDVYEARRQYRGNSKTRLPKILIFDIETSPTIAYTWNRWNENISLDQVIQDPIILTWSAKWLYNIEVMSDAITPKEVKNFDDSRIVKSLHNLIDEADIVVAHFGNGFDIPFMNYRYVVHGLKPNTYYHSIDTKKVASKVFKFPSNKLDGIASYLGLDGKLSTTFKLWKNCMEGHQQSIDEMQVYNIQDVKALEEVYLKLRPWIKSHPNVGLYDNTDQPQCAACGSTSVKENGYYYTPTGKYPVYQCTCGANSRGRTSVLDKDKRKSILVSNAR